MKIKEILSKWRQNVLEVKWRRTKMRWRQKALEKWRQNVVEGHKVVWWHGMCCGCGSGCSSEVVLWLV